MLAGLAPGGKEALPAWEATIDALDALAADLGALHAMLADHTSTSIRLVLTPERVVAAGRLDQAFLSCGNQDARVARAVNPRLRVCNLARQRTRAAYVDHAISTGAHFIQFHHLRGPLEPELADRAHAAGVRVNYFCAEEPTPAELEALFAAGVDFVLVDDVEQGPHGRTFYTHPPTRTRSGRV